ncbi:MAG: TerB family tellurite resistance protein [Thalassobaculum sp.]|uniref:TerB family tellurite resistance protein n=1 Tax=Thalassobaculum sp. TaxID=2022740 RepID=UPI0032ED0D1C
MAEGFLQTVRREVERFQNRSFLEAVMAVAALAAMADGEYGLAEKYRAEELLAEIPIFDVFDLSEAMEILDEDVFALRENRAAASRELEARVAAYADEPDRARTLLRAAHAIITSDGVTTESERAEFERLAGLLALSVVALALK